MKFECQPNCGKCCTGEGFVYLNVEDIGRLANHLEMSALKFAAKYCDRTDGRLHLKVDGKCPFLEGWKCTVQKFKPTQCRTFPFWPKVNMKEVGEWCPGVGVGKDYTEEEIKELETQTAAVLPGYQIVAR